MKKKKVTRALSVLLAATLISTSVISGTFAKYTAKVEGSDSARVAKWGVVITKTGTSSFKDEYSIEDSSAKEAKLTTAVKGDVSSDKVNGLVAPGTGNVKAQVDGSDTSYSFVDNSDPLTYTLTTDKTEVATRYTLKIKPSDVPTVKQGEHTLKDGTKITTSSDYTPIMFYLGFKYGDKISGVIPIGHSVAELKTAATALQTELEKNTFLKKHNVKVTPDDTEGSISVSADFEATSAINSVSEPGISFSLGWSWQFDGAHDGFNAEAVDQLDTLLGEVAAGTVTDSNVTTNVNLAFDASATQID